MTKKQHELLAMMSKWNRMEYPIRLKWYRTKLAIGIEPKSDKNFLAHDFAKRLERGLLPPDARFTIAGRLDGVGMQAMARLSGLLFAHVFGATYVDTPFRSIDHVNNNNVSAWEDLLNLGRGEESVSGREDRVICYADILAGRAQWSKDVILRLPQCFWLYRRHPYLLDRSTSIFTSRYEWPKQSDDPRLSVAVHVRRGDVAKNRNSMRYTENSVILRVIAGVEESLQQLGLAWRVTVHSQGDPLDFEEFTKRGYALKLAEDATIAMRAFIESDVLLMSKSSFSYLAAIYNRGVKLYYPTFNPCLASWVKVSKGGSFNQARFAEAIRKGKVKGQTDVIDVRS